MLSVHAPEEAVKAAHISLCQVGQCHLWLPSAHGAAYPHCFLGSK